MRMGRRSAAGRWRAGWRWSFWRSWMSCFLIYGKLAKNCEGLKRRHSIITEVRSKGMMFGIQLSAAGQPVVKAALGRGLLLNCTHETVLRLLPPFVLNREQAREVVRILDEVLP